MITFGACLDVNSFFFLHFETAKNDIVGIQAMAQIFMVLDTLNNSASTRIAGAHAAS
jgi:hypothetical protein